MKYLLITLFSIVYLFSVCLAEERLELKDQKDKESYGLGYQSGQTLKFQGVDINPDVYISGIKDALRGTQPQMSQEEIRATIKELQKRVMALQQKELREKAAMNLAEGKTFLEENKKREGIKTLPSGLQYKVLTDGSGKTPQKTDDVTVHYRGTLIDGTEFDSSRKREEPATFQVDSVIPGWTEALQLMKEGSKWQLFVPPELGYGERGMGRIPPNSALIFDIELLSIKDGSSTSAVQPMRGANSKTRPRTKD
jgi:FKBP-type peptidyl-prolyl cis-trans isomerase FklB